MRTYKQVFLVFFLISTAAQCVVWAGISPLAFKNVNQVFKEEHEYTSPIYGSIALTSGLIENLRFYNVHAFYNKDGKRDYIKDKAPQDDLFMEIILILFPSPAGQLTTITDAPTNFGRYCTPEHVAALLNFTNAISEHCVNKKTKLPNTIDKILKTVGQEKAIAQAFPAEIFKKTPLNKLLTALAKSTELEINPPKNIPEEYFYPWYFREQIINAFFCHTFADQESLRKLLSALDQDIVHHDKIALIDGLITEKDVEQSIAKLVPGTSINLDDVWAILNRGIFGRVMPYDSGKDPISNGSAEFYKRSSNSLSNKTFADCIEVSLRHVVNCMLYNSLDKKFDMAALDEHLKDKNNAYIENLKAFYALQSPDKANAGDTAIRSAWNKVVADLGNGVQYRHKFDAADTENNNELDSGMLNIMRAFKTIFSLDLKAEPTYAKRQEEAFKKDVQEWITDGFEKLCKALNPDHICGIAYSDIKIDESRNDLLGNIDIEVADSSKEKIFSLTLKVTSGHVYIQNLNILDKGFMHLTQENFEVIKNSVVHDYYYGTVQASLGLLDSEVPREVQLPSQTLYMLFNKAINDSDSIRQASSFLSGQVKYKSISTKRAAPILKNILHSCSWDDMATVRMMAHTINHLKELSVNPEDPLTQAVQHEVKGLYFGDDVVYLQSFAQFFPNILSLYIGSPFNKEIDKVENIGGFTRLKKLDLDHVKSINFPDTMDSLEEITISNMKESLNLKSTILPNLKKIDLFQVKSINFPDSMNSIEDIKIFDCGTQDFILPICSKLKKLNLLEATLKSVTFQDPTNSVEEISIVKATEITNLTFPSCPDLKKLDLASGMHNLKSITFTGPMPNLIELNVIDRGYSFTHGMQEIIGIDFCPKLDRTKIPRGITLK